jgi:hypothetical protein
MIPGWLVGLVATKSAKIGGGLIAGGGSLALILNLIGTRLDDLNQKIDDKDKAIREYVDFKHDVVIREMRFLNETQLEMKNMLKVMGDRMYEERKRKREE